MDQQAHYVCTGTCGGVADSASSCQSGDCPKQGQPMKACACHDGQHTDQSAE